MCFGTDELEVALTKRNEGVFSLRSSCEFEKLSNCISAINHSVTYDYRKIISVLVRIVSVR